MAGMPGIVIRIGADTAAAIRGIEQTQRALGGVGAKTAGAASAIRSAMVPATAALTALGGGALYAANAASDLEQATGAMQAVFGPASAALAELAGNANALGLSTADYNQQAALMGALLKSSGADIDDLAGATDGLITSAADMAAQFGGDTATAVGALGSMLKGSYEVLDNYGIKMTAAEVKSYAAAQGISTADAQLALLNQKLEETGTQGAAAREIDTLASQTQQARAAFEDASAELGTALLPHLADLAGIAADVAGWVGENSELVGILAAVIGGAAAAVVVLNTALSIYTTVQAAANTALLGFPLTWVVLAIAAVIAAAVALWKNWDTVTAFLRRAWDAVANAFRAGGDAIGRVFASIKTAAAASLNWVIDRINALIRTINKLPLVDIGEIPSVGGGSARTARGAARTGAAGTAAAGGVVVQFYGPVGDPEATAREIGRALAGSAARNGAAVHRSW